MKTKIIIYCGEDGLGGKAEGLSRRNDDTVTALACCYAFDGQPETCDRVVIMPDVPEYRREKIVDAYTCKVEVLRERSAMGAVPIDLDANEPGPFRVPEDIATQIVATATKRQRRPRKAKVEEQAAPVCEPVPDITSMDVGELFEPPFVTPDDPAWKGPTE